MIPVCIQAKVCSSAGIARLKNFNRRTVDVLASRLYFYYSLSYELTGALAEIRGYVYFCGSMIARSTIDASTVLDAWIQNLLNLLMSWIKNKPEYLNL